MSDGSQVWMSHGDTILSIPDGFEVISSTHDVKVAGFKIADEKTYGIQFHPEVYHTTEGSTLLKNYVVDICGCSQTWTPDNFIQSSIDSIKNTVGTDKVIMGLSGGVDSTVAPVRVLSRTETRIGHRHQLAC